MSVTMTIFGYLVMCKIELAMINQTNKFKPLPLSVAKTGKATQFIENGMVCDSEGSLKVFENSTIRQSDFSITLIVFEIWQDICGLSFILTNPIDLHLVPHCR